MSDLPLTDITIIHNMSQLDITPEQRDSLLEAGLIYFDDDCPPFYTAPWDVTWEQIEAHIKEID